MESSLQLEVVTPDKVVLSTTADYVGVPGIAGRFGVLPHHVPLLCALGVGGLYYRTATGTDQVFVSGGFVEVSDNTISVLTEAAECAADIDIARAQEAKRRAEERLASQDEAVDAARAHAALSRAVARLGVAGVAC